MAEDRVMVPLTVNPFGHLLGHHVGGMLLASHVPDDPYDVLKGG